jgi:hypothetical protein
VIIPHPDESEEGSNPVKKASKTGGADKSKRGFVTHYLISLDEKTLFENTLTGALIKLIKENGALTVDDIILYIGHSYDLFRNSKGQTYNSDCRKAI